MVVCPERGVNDLRAVISPHAYYTTVNHSNKLVVVLAFSGLCWYAVLLVCLALQQSITDDLLYHWTSRCICTFSCTLFDNSSCTVLHPATTAWPSASMTSVWTCYAANNVTHLPRHWQICLCLAFKQLYPNDLIRHLIKEIAVILSSLYFIYICTTVYWILDWCDAALNILLKCSASLVLHQIFDVTLLHWHWWRLKNSTKTLYTLQ